MRIRFVAIVCFLTLLSFPCMAGSLPARVAFLGAAPATNPIAEKNWQAFTEALQALGWTEGKNITFISRNSAGRAERAAALAAELVAERPEVIVAVTYPNAKAVQQSTKTIPIVFVNVPDPVGLELVASIARPGANVTGISDQTQDFLGKALQLLKEARPGISRIAYLGYGESV
jgi:putative ABC transport system substrate-binding protein